MKSEDKQKSRIYLFLNFFFSSFFFLDYCWLHLQFQGQMESNIAFSAKSRSPLHSIAAFERIYQAANRFALECPMIDECFGSSIEFSARHNAKRNKIAENELNQLTYRRQIISLLRYPFEKSFYQ
jgi:hypothetical protein